MFSNFPVGICSQMCPEDEIERREKQGRLHILEISSDKKYTKRPQANRKFVVKEFSRSAAGRATQDVKDLRNEDGLLLTVDYLLHDVTMNEDLPWYKVYDFIMDRLRAVRQDMVIQNMSRAFCISLLQPMIKFYVYSAYRLCNEPPSKFDPVLNNSHLQECLKRLLCMYDDLDILMLKVSKKGDILNKNMLYSQCRPFMESLYLILNLGNTIAMNRALQLPPLWKNNLVRKCLKLSFNYWRENYVRVCRDIQTLPPLLSACAVLHLPQLRKKALATMSVAYSCKNNSFTAKTLQILFLYNNMKDLLHDCKQYGITVDGDKIFFNKTSFQNINPEPLSKHCTFVNNLLAQQNIPTLLLEDNLDELN